MTNSAAAAASAPEPLGARTAAEPASAPARLGVRDACTYLLARALLLPVELAPLAWALWCARRLGTLAYLLARGRRRVVEHNLVQVYGARMTTAERRRFARRAFQNFAMTAVETLQMPRLIRSGALDRLVARRGHFAEARALIAAGKGVLFVGLHAGAWEFYLPCLALEGIHPLAVMQPTKKPWATALIRRGRAGHAELLVDKKGALRAVARGVASGAPVALLLDQNDRHGVFVDFLGRAARTNPIAGLLSQRYGVAIAVGSIQRIEPGRAYRFYLSPPRIHTPAGDVAERIRSVTAAVTREIEKHWRAMPEQWLWLHQRWKDRPDGSRERLK